MANLCAGRWDASSSQRSDTDSFLLSIFAAPSTTPLHNILYFYQKRVLIYRVGYDLSDKSHEI